jgi:hypothetical protein
LLAMRSSNSWSRCRSPPVSAAARSRVIALEP